MPDIARGIMLLVVMIANSAFYISGHDRGLLWRPADPGAADRAADAFAALFIDNRAFPMFAFLFAYGIHQLAHREVSRGTSWRHITGLLMKRNLWLLAIGTAHYLLLFTGDIIMTYAICGLALMLMLRAPKWLLWAIFAITIVPFTATGSNDVEPALQELPAEAMTGYNESATVTSATEAIRVRAASLADHAALLPWDALRMLAPMSLALLLARPSILEWPWERPRLVAALGWGGLAAAILGGLPLAHGLAFGFQQDASWALAGMLSKCTGVLAGIGWPCLIALAVSRRQREHNAGPAARLGPAGSALQALGKRSMSGYIAQSACSVILFPPYALGLGSQFGTFGMTMISIAIWTTTLAAAVILERLGKPGPMEWLLRRLSYGRR